MSTDALADKHRWGSGLCFDVSVICSFHKMAAASVPDLPDSPRASDANSGLMCLFTDSLSLERGWHGLL